MAARNVDDLLASFFSCSRLRTPERDGCFISRTVTMIADENRKPAHRYRPIIEPLRFLLRLPTPGEAVVKPCGSQAAWERDAQHHRST
jgi:hypothetical protein